MTANELFKLYMEMSYEDRQAFIAMFKPIYSWQQTAKAFDKLDRHND
jgi:hypothetical protein